MKFRSLQPTESDGLSAEWVSSEDFWQLRDAPTDSVLRRFKTLAGWAAEKLRKGSEWQAFLSVLREQHDTGRLLNTTMSKLADGREVIGQVWAIERVCEAAADLCERHLPDDEIDAHKQRRFERIMDLVQGLEVQGKPTPEPSIGHQKKRRKKKRRRLARNGAVRARPESIGEQLNRLRDECNWTIEELAEKISVNVRTVQRHLADESKPYKRHLSAYQRVISKRLNRQVVIKKMP